LVWDGPQNKMIQNKLYIKISSIKIISNVPYLQVICIKRYKVTIKINNICNFFYYETYLISYIFVKKNLRVRTRIMLNT
jgi:hypothetical protein